MTLTLRVDLGAIHVHALTKFHGPMWNGSRDMNFDLVTDIHTDIQNAMHMSPPCIRTGGLKNHYKLSVYKVYLLLSIQRAFLLMAIL